MRVLASAVAALVLVAGVTLLPVSNATPEEDEMGWDCHTMGNRHCGEGEIY